MPDSLDRELALACIQAGILLYWRALGGARGMELHAEDGLEWACSYSRRGPERIFQACLARAGLDRRLEAIVAAMKAGSLPDSLLLGPGVRPANLAQLLYHRGLTNDTSGACMALALEGFQPPAPRDASIQVQVVEDLERLHPWVEIVNVALAGFPILSFEGFQDIFRQAGASFFLATFDDVPAAACMTLASGELATLEMVATLVKYRNLGLGTAVTSASLTSLRECGTRVVSLRGEPEAINLYKRLGFREYCRRVVASF
jgi:ribosomal protein S18 acetylase RimI-like enzyme